MSRSFARFWGVVLTLGLTISGLVFAFATVDDNHGNPQDLAIASLVVMGAFYVFMIRGPVGKAIARMLEGTGGLDDQLATRLKQLEAQQADLLAEQERMIELEERLDFAERILAERHAPAKLEERQPAVTSRNFSKALGVILALGLTIVGMGFISAMIDESRNIKNPAPVVFGMLAAAAIFFGLLRGGVGRAIGRMLEGQAEPDDQLAARVDQLELMIQDLNADQQRLSELEERVDFAERLLAQRNEPAAIRPPEVH